LFLIPLLMFTLPTMYQYNLTIVIINNGETLFPGDPIYDYFLTQNIFPNSSYQQVFIEKVSLNGTMANFKIFFDEDGNPFIKIISDVPLNKGESMSLSIIFSIQLKEKHYDISNVGKISDIPKDIIEKYSLTGIWQVTESQKEEILNFLNSIIGDEENVLFIILKILNWFENTMKYSFGLFAPQDVWYTYSSKSGDCDDMANLFVLFCRCLNIPAYTAIGAVYIPGINSLEQDGNMIFNLNNVAWHGWAMVYLPKDSGGSWYPVDFTFFRGAYFVNGHIKSQNLIDHITYSCFYTYPTFEFLSINYQNYIKEFNNIREIIQKSNISWIEYHQVTFMDTNHIVDYGIIVLVIFIILALLILHKIRSVIPHEAPSSI
ncbi:MAG: transglutaminase-like domain-containing protein, partial [Candidatus Methanomethylicaceae archaeon]